MTARELASRALLSLGVTAVVVPCVLFGILSGGFLGFLVVKTLNEATHDYGRGGMLFVAAVVSIGAAFGAWLAIRLPVLAWPKQRSFVVPTALVLGAVLALAFLATVVWDPHARQPFNLRWHLAWLLVPYGIAVLTGWLTMRRSLRATPDDAAEGVFPFTRK